MVARRHHRRRHLHITTLAHTHLRNAHSDRLAFRRHQHHLLAHLDAVGEAQQTGDHQLRAVANGVHRRVLHHDLLVLDQQHLQRTDHATQVLLALHLTLRLFTHLAVLVAPLRVQHVVHRHHAVVLRDVARAHATQLLHVTARAQQQTQVHAQRTDVRARLAAHPEHAQLVLRVVLDHLAVVDAADTQLALHGSDQRRTLEQRARQLLQRLLQLDLVVDGVVQADDRHVLLTRALLALHQSRGTVDTDDQAARDLRVQRTAVTGSLAAEDLLYPGDDFVGGGISGFVEVDASIAIREVETERLRNVLLDGTIQRRIAHGNGSVVVGAHIQFVVVLEEKRPLARVQFGSLRLRLDDILGFRGCGLFLALFLYPITPPAELRALPPAISV